MSDELEQLEDWVAPLIRQLQPAQRKQLTRRLARDLRRSQKQRIAAQQNPDGSAYAPRKPQAWKKQGSIKRRALFSQIRTARYMKARGSIDTASVGFTGRVATIARVHQLGETAKVDKNGPRYNYPRRQLLGFTQRDRVHIGDAILAHLSERGL